MAHWGLRIFAKAVAWRWCKTRQRMRTNAPLVDVLAVAPVDLLLPLAELPPRLLEYTRGFSTLTAGLAAGADDELLAPEHAGSGQAAHDRHADAYRL